MRRHYQDDLKDKEQGEIKHIFTLKYEKGGYPCKYSKRIIECYYEYLPSTTKSMMYISMSRLMLKKN
jgi:hypothetical protein